MKKINRIGLINTPIYDNDEGIYPPLGLISIATYLKERCSYDVQVYDLAYLIYSKKKRVDENFYLNFSLKIKEQSNDIIGITCQNYSLASALLLAQNIKQNCPHVNIFLGGVGVHGIAEILMKIFKFIDYIVIGEGEETTKDLLETIENDKWDRLLGVYYRNNNGIVYNGNHPLVANLNELPLPDFSILGNVENYFSLFDNGRRALNVELARGCNGGCAFCGCFSFWCGQHRYFNINRMFEHIEFVVNRYGVNHVYLSDDNFMSNKNMVEYVCNEFTTRKLDVTWDTRGRVNDMDLILLKKMHKAGCSEILIGIESSDNLVLKMMNKRVLAEQQYQAVVNVMDAGILPILSLILGYEGETKDSINRTLSFLLKLYRLEKPMVAYFHILSIVPGTKLYDKNIDLLANDTVEEVTDNLKYGNEEIPSIEKRLLNQYPKLFSTFYHVSSLVDFRLLKTISALATIVLPTFRFTLSIVEKKYGNIVWLFERYSEQFSYTGEEDVLIKQFANIIFNNFGSDIYVKNMLIYESIVHKLNNIQNGDAVYVTFDVDIHRLRKWIDYGTNFEIDVQKRKYKFVKEKSVIRVFSDY